MHRLFGFLIVGQDFFIEAKSPATFCISLGMINLVAVPLATCAALQTLEGQEGASGFDC
jgi:hypothetical protein